MVEIEDSLATGKDSTPWILLIKELSILTGGLKFMRTIMEEQEDKVLEILMAMATEKIVDPVTLIAVDRVQDIRRVKEEDTARLEVRKIIRAAIPPYPSLDKLHDETALDPGVVCQNVSPRKALE